MAEDKKIFADGFSFKRRDEEVAFLNSNAKNGWVNIDIKQSQKGTYYCELDTWVPKEKSSQGYNPKSTTDDLPF